MWEDNNVNTFKENSKEMTLNFIKEARKENKYQSIGAFKDNELIGSVSLNKFLELNQLIKLVLFGQFMFIQNIEKEELEQD